MNVLELYSHHKYAYFVSGLEAVLIRFLFSVHVSYMNSIDNKF